MNAAAGRSGHNQPPTVDRTPLCGAPFVAMEFDAFGDVQICCANSLYPIGNVQHSTLREIWEGDRARTIRAALTENDMSYGCSVCRYRLTFGHGDLARDYYDNFPMPELGPDGQPAWPHSLQFSLHNTCNLECVMCGADRSSKIRTRRSGLEPLPHAYDDAFFEQIVPFLEHAGAVDFSGGEPFLIREHHRIWDLLIGMEARPLCSLTTNGTVWNDQVERVLGGLDTHISVSVDGMSAATFEAIRVGANFDEVMTNIDRFVAYTRERGTVMTMSWSLVRNNWWELGAAARFAEERGINLKVQTVIEPEFGVQRLPTDELRVVVESLQAETESLLPDLDRNRDMWLREVARLEEELALRDHSGLRAMCMEPASPDNAAHVAAMILDVAGRTVDSQQASALRDEAATDLHRWCGDEAPVHQVRVDHSGTVLSADSQGLLPAGDSPTDLVDLLQRLETAHDGVLWIAEEFDETDRLVHTLWMGRPVRDKVGLSFRLVSIATEDEITVLVALDEGLRNNRAVPVSLRPTR